MALEKPTSKQRIRARLRLAGLQSLWKAARLGSVFPPRVQTHIGLDAARARHPPFLPRCHRLNPAVGVVARARSLEFTNLQLASFEMRRKAIRAACPPRRGLGEPRALPSLFKASPRSAAPPCTQNRFNECDSLEGLIKIKCRVHMREAIFHRAERGKTLRPRPVTRFEASFSLSLIFERFSFFVSACSTRQTHTQFRLEWKIARLGESACRSLRD